MALAPGAGGGTSGKPTKPGKLGQIIGSYTWDGSKWVLSSTYKPASAGGTVVKQGNYAALKPKTTATLNAKTAKGGTKGTTATAKAVAKAVSKLPKTTQAPLATPINNGPANNGPVNTPPVNTPPVDDTPAMDQPAQNYEAEANTPAPWELEKDAVYQAALASGKSAFSFAQAQALADMQNQQTGAAQERKQLDVNSAENRRRLAGNYAARGMAGGAAGALTMAEARANAEQVAARTSITDQIAALNNQYLATYGNAASPGYDWTGTLIGQQYKTQAAQAAINAQLARYGAV